MAEIRWTDEQLEDITSSGEALLVSAAAGSGKTTVLIEKLKRLLNDSGNDVSADNIVVVTFTNEAASQMKNRLHRELTKALDEDGCDISYISEQISLIPTADISTIHSFCFRLIRENAGILGLDPGFGIAEPSDEDHIVIKATDTVFDELYDEKAPMIERLLSVFCPNAKDPSALKDIIRRLRTKLLALPFPESFAEQRTDNYLRGISDSDNIISAYCDMITKELENAYLYAEAAVRFIAVHKNEIPSEKYEALLDFVKKDMYSISDIVQHYREKASSPLSVLDAEDIILCKFTICSFELDDGTDGHKILKNELIDKYRKICSSYLRVIYLDKGTEKPDEATPKSLFTPAQIKNDYRIHAEISDMLFDIVARVREEEKRLKAEKNVLGFSDAEQY
ncbi:MAG: UvrD-helicase domain-containing protein, partial [Ruminococcus sp.]|nr:UvrD-helicase domain-containing protein [Ruminococcus sp.]